MIDKINTLLRHYFNRNWLLCLISYLEYFGTLSDRFFVYISIFTFCKIITEYVFGKSGYSLFIVKANHSKFWVITATGIFLPNQFLAK